VRRLAAEIGLPNASKKDSTGICFIGERPFREFLGRYLKQQPGPMLDERGREVGRHQGLSFYTLGQRQGLGIGGVKSGGGEHAAWYVAAKESDRNVLRVVQGHEHPALLSRSLRADDCSWISGRPPSIEWLAAKTRYRQTDAACRFEPRGDGFSLHFEQAQWAVTPGQSAVLYDGDVCLGGGVIVDSAR
jgi:tRNA-uridine 2-sulfurtransferase